MEEKIVQNEVESTKSCTLAVKMENDTEMKKPQIDRAKIGNNPFLLTLSIPVTKIVSNKELIEDVDGSIINKTLYKEKTQKVEIYYHECARDNIAKLSDKAQRLLLHILYTLDRNDDCYWLNKHLYMKGNEIKSNTTVSNAVNELIRYQYLLKTACVGWYWINPYRFYPGSRLSKYPDKRVVKDDWDQTKGEPYKPKEKKKSFNMGEKSRMEEQEEKAVKVYTNDV